MKHALTAFAFALAALLCVSCADDAEFTTTVAELSESERAAMAQCLADIKDCREASADADDFAENCQELMACLPERDGEQATAPDWRRYCAGVEARCSEGDIDETTCAELRARCDAARSAAGSEATNAGVSAETSAAMKACYEGCMEDGGAPEECRATCTNVL